MKENSNVYNLKFSSNIKTGKLYINKKRAYRKVNLLIIETHHSMNNDL